MSFCTDTVYLYSQTTRNFANGDNYLIEMTHSKMTKILVCIRSIAEKTLLSIFNHRIQDESELTYAMLMTMEQISFTEIFQGKCNVFLEEKDLYKIN